MSLLLVVHRGCYGGLRFSLIQFHINQMKGKEIN
ncbi:hypothetical protein SETIT_6G025500v2 [Setaria italica]|uniref:Uncharacterized protein n=1 Tax=Setaria italica TaxID=4555 RepID=A0A368RHJ4_SETIT|nr:hypothetical protein SETIT_6G025500v2 [Setaria italica]